MGVSSKKWADGQLSDSAAAVMTVGAAESAVTPELRLFSESGSEIDIDLYLNFGGSDIQFAGFAIPAGGSARVLLPDLPAGAVVKGAASTASVINYVTTGGAQTC